MGEGSSQGGADIDATAEVHELPPSTSAAVPAAAAAATTAGGQQGPPKLGISASGSGFMDDGGPSPSPAGAERQALERELQVAVAACVAEAVLPQVRLIYTRS